MKKQFCSDLYDQNDTPAREVLRQSFDRIWGIDLQDNPDKYGADLLAFIGETFIGFVEFEVKHNWQGYRFPFSTVHFPKRKERIFESQPLIFVMLNQPMTRFVWFPFQAIAQGARIEKKTKLTDFDEGFIEVPVSLGRFRLTGSTLEL